MENFWDRAARRLRPYFWGAGLFAIPVFFVSYAVMARMALETWPVWLGLVVAVCHALTWIVFATIHDWQRERRQRRE